MGMTEEEMKKSTRKQVGISLLAPSLLGLIHAGVAVFLLEDVMEVKVILPPLASILVFVLLYQATTSQLFRQRVAARQ